MGKSLEIGFELEYPAIEDCRDFHPSPGVNDATLDPTPNTLNAYYEQPPPPRRLSFPH